MATTLEQVDPNRAKARAALKEEDMDVESLDGEWTGYKQPLPTPSTSYADTPVLTLRELMPGSTGDDAEDKDLDQSLSNRRTEDGPLSPSPHDGRRPP